jgi:3-methyladenine DNA glycosylase Mpg
VNATRPGDLRVERGNALRFKIAATPRIGVTKCADWPLRFYIAGNPCVSGGRRHSA